MVDIVALVAARITVATKDTIASIGNTGFCIDQLVGILTALSF